MPDLLGIGLGLADQRRQAFAQRGDRGLVEAEVDLTGIDQVLALAAADIDAVPLAAVERESRNGQGLTLGTGLLDPVVASAGSVAAVTDLGDDAFQANRAGVRKHLTAVDLEALAELDVGLCDQLFRCAFRSIRGSFRRS